ncbi:IS30 family transposase, partial [Agromyces luteolus]|uniref:IS30 family transposase n=1 Tax=Agromyces luteolus TaxID=88373 RepID=UPI003CD09044
MSRIQAARRVGVHPSTGDDWYRGIRKSRGRRLFPDGRIVGETPGVNDAVPVARLEAVLDRRFLSLEERERIHDLLLQRASVRAIGRALGRSASTISREIARNRGPDGGYRPYQAHRASARRRSRPKLRKLDTCPRLRAYVVAGLRRRWSPQQICHAMVRDFPGDPEMRVVHETIYQALYVQGRGALKKEIQTALRTGRARRKPRRAPGQRTPRFADGMIMISDRPAEIEDRAVPGHWEGDLIMGAGNASAIATLVERSTRYVMLAHLPHGDHTAEAVRDALVSTMQTLPAHLRGSLTWDQGNEMARHKAFTIATDMPVYFCDPASPWQRGTNENTNGLLRQYFPKGTDLSTHGPEDLERVAQELNGRPRQTLGWDNPA